MRKPYFVAVIGKNFGDEGKGMAVDFLSFCHEKVLVVRHNGGAQSGHTVDMPDKRFVFHELSSGSFRGADTFWAKTYFPDIYKLADEVEDFYRMNGFVPDIYGDYNLSVTIIDDVLINMAIEEARGKNRHGSCGMGIYEAYCRKEAGFDIKLGELFEMDCETLFNRLSHIRENYTSNRLKELDLSVEKLGEFKDLLESPQILANVAEIMINNIKYVHLIKDVNELFCGYDKVIFENGQGLLLDSENEEYSPHVSASRTGLVNPVNILSDITQSLDEVVYVTRSYVTRHGAGPLKNECSKMELGITHDDITNVENRWQGFLRYAKHGEVKEFIKEVKEDLKILDNCKFKPACSLLITHLNETNDSVICENNDYMIGDFIKLDDIKCTFDRFYISDSPYSMDIKKMLS